MECTRIIMLYDDAECFRRLRKTHVDRQWMEGLYNAVAVVLPSKYMHRKRLQDLHTLPANIECVPQSVTQPAQIGWGRQFLAFLTTENEKIACPGTGYVENPFLFVIRLP